MMRTGWFRYAIMGIYALVMASLVAHSVRSYVEYSQARSNEPTSQTVMVSTPPAESVDSRTLVKTILSGRLFTLLPNQEDALTGQNVVPPPPPLDVAKKVLLLGTVVDSSGGGLAIFQDVSSKEQKLYHLNDVMPSVGLIAEIEKDRVLFKKDRQEEWLTLAVEQLHTGFERRIVAFSPSTSPQSISARPTQTIATTVSRTRMSIDRKDLLVVSQDPSQLFGQGRPIPVVTNERVDGIVLEVINHYSFYGQLGFVSGDVVKRINGVELRDLSLFVSAFQQMKDERTIRIDILRNSRPKTLTIHVM